MADQLQPIPPGKKHNQVEIYPPPALRLRHPIILAHGLFGFDQDNYIITPFSTAKALNGPDNLMVEISYRPKADAESQLCVDQALERLWAELGLSKASISAYRNSQIYSEIDVDASPDDADDDHAPPAPAHYLVANEQDPAAAYESADSEADQLEEYPPATFAPLLGYRFKRQALDQFSFPDGFCTGVTLLFRFGHFSQ